MAARSGTRRSSRTDLCRLKAANGSSSIAVAVANGGAATTQLTLTNQGLPLGARYGLSSTWSLEAALNRQTGTEAGAVNLRQTGVVAGPRRSWIWNRHWQGFAHVLAGYEHLSAWEGSASDTKDSLALVAGIGADYALNSHVSFRVEEDYSQTHYAGLPQRSTCFNLGIVLRK